MDKWEMIVHFVKFISLLKFFGFTEEIFVKIVIKINTFKTISKSKGIFYRILFSFLNVFYFFLIILFFFNLKNEIFNLIMYL